MRTQDRVLMCRPSFFEVSYSINPWMDTEDAVVLRRAMAQWQNLAEEISQRCSVLVAEPTAGLPDMCFAANAGLVYNGIFVPSRFRHKQRQPESAAFAHWFAQMGFALRTLPEDVLFEGAGDALFDAMRGTLWMGFGPRSEREAAAHLAAQLDIDVTPLRLVDPRFYHLDTCFCPLSNGCVMYVPSAFDIESQRAIEARVKPQDRIVVGEIDAQALACNVVDLGDRVLTNRASAALRERLSERGVSVRITPLQEFLKAGGGAKCLCLPLAPPTLQRRDAPDAAHVSTGDAGSSRAQSLELHRAVA